MIRALAAMLLVAATPALAQNAPPPAAPQPPAQAPTPSPALQSRIDALPAILNGTVDFESYFAAAFKAQVPKAQFTQLTTQITGQIGAAVKVESVTPVSPNAATLKLGFEKGVATLAIAVDPTPPHTVTGLRITEVAPRGDSLATIERELRALPGQTALAVHSLDNGLRPVHDYAADTRMPIGSAFKLWVLAEAARQVKAGTRTWRDVLPLGPRSLPTGITQSWPQDAPVTLHSLATLMISLSDNTATDTLIRALGRERIDAMVATAGVADPAATQPVLTTIEALRLKTPANTDLATAWRDAGPAGRRKLLSQNAARLTATRVDPAMFGDRPLALDVEWFASPRDMARTLDWLRVNGGDSALAILAINPGTASATQFDYVGFKGGSEPGVVFGAWMVRTRQGHWFTVTAGWTRPDARVEEGQFFTLMNRALTQIAPR